MIDAVISDSLQDMKFAFRYSEIDIFDRFHSHLDTLQCIMIILKKALRFGQPPPSTQHVVPTMGLIVLIITWDVNNWYYNESGINASLFMGLQYLYIDSNNKIDSSLSIELINIGDELHQWGLLQIGLWFKLFIEFRTTYPWFCLIYLINHHLFYIVQLNYSSSMF